MIIVAHLYNNNGMASWCWEAAHALAEAGRNVRLVCSPDVSLPGESKVEVIRFEARTLSHQNKLSHAVGRLSDASSGFVGQLQRHLEGMGIRPTHYLLNQSNLQDPDVDIPQHIVAWAYPTSLRAYLSKIGVISNRKFSADTVRVCMDAIGWWRKDWRAYRSATSVLAVTQRLQAELSAEGIHAAVVHPGTAVSPSQRYGTETNQPCRILVAALDLEEPRKRVRFLLHALTKCSADSYSLTLVGHASEDLKAWANKNNLPAKFVGKLLREEVQKIMAEHDVFLFGSCMDDWGYVLVEAMSQGMCVVAPQMPPFDEILESAGLCYAAYSEDDLILKLSTLLQSNWRSYQETAHARAETFSRAAFSRNLLAAVEAK